MASPPARAAMPSTSPALRPGEPRKAIAATATDAPTHAARNVVRDARSRRRSAHGPLATARSPASPRLMAEVRRHEIDPTTTTATEPATADASAATETIVPALDPSVGVPARQWIARTRGSAATAAKSSARYVFE
jgi:hypothetical protein